MHNDLGALPELLDAVVGFTHILAQVMLADVVDGQDAGELCVSLLGAPLGYPFTPVCLPTPREAQGQQVVLAVLTHQGTCPAQLTVALEAYTVFCEVENFPIRLFCGFLG